MSGYSQFGEDLIIAGLLGGIKARVLDIGAWDPKCFSNSRLLIEQGWPAVLVEFSPGPVRSLVKEYGSREDIIIIQAALSVDGNGSLRRFDITDDSVSTATAAIHEKWAQAGGYYGHLWVPQLTLSQLFLQLGGGFEFVSIDTEGTSVDLTRQLLTETQVYPRVVCVEHDDRLVELYQIAEKAGYRIRHVNGTNAILSRD